MSLEGECRSSRDLDREDRPFRKLLILLCGIVRNDRNYRRIYPLLRNKETAKANGCTLKKPSDNKVVRLNNLSCPYCGVELTQGISEKEHVIGRRFVPKSKLDNCWNLILNACKTCNGNKADLENDISAVTMQPDAFGRFGHDDATGRSEATRKAENSYSRRTKKLVKHSHEQIRIDMPFRLQESITFGLAAPPQVDAERVFELARLQLVGFFYWLTFEKNRKCGYWWLGEFYPVVYANYSDWGSAVLRAFGDSVVNWGPCLRVVTADEFYKIVLRKHAKDNCWSWALEWNHALRVVGFFGDLQTAKNVEDEFPKLSWCVIPARPDAHTRFRPEIPLSEAEDDKLFYWHDRKI